MVKQYKPEPLSEEEMDRHFEEAERILAEREAARLAALEADGQKDEK